MNDAPSLISVRWKQCLAVLNHLLKAKFQLFFFLANWNEKKNYIAYNIPREIILSLKVFTFLSFSNESINRLWKDILGCQEPDILVSRATGYGLDNQRFRVWVPVGSRLFFTLSRPARLSGPRSLLSNAYRGLRGRGVKLTTHLQPVPRSRKCGAINPFPHTPSWRSAKLIKNRDNFTF
jgi:hypothetical protein